MRFLWSPVLWFLLAVPCLAAVYLLSLRRKTAAVRYASLTLIRAGMTRAHRLRRHVPPLLFVLAIVVSILGIARPAATIDSASRQRTVVLAIDVSLSMAAEDVKPSRLAAAQAAGRTFIAAQPSDVRIGIVTFAGDADLVQPPTRDREKTLQALEGLSLRYHTAIGSGLIAALLTLFPEEDIGSEFEIFGMGRSPVEIQPVALRTSARDAQSAVPRLAPGSNRSVAIVLLTDGRDTGGPPPLRAARFAEERGVRVYTVGFGQPGPALLDIRGQNYDVSLDEDTLKDIARITQGEYYHAATAEQLNDVYRELRGRIVLERHETELTALFTALSGILLLSAAALSLAWFHRVA